MHRYSEELETYVKAVENMDISELTKLREWLKESKNIQITCDAYNEDSHYESYYSDIFLASIGLGSSIYAVLQSNEMSMKRDEYIVERLAEEYFLLRGAARIFNKNMK